MPASHASTINPAALPFWVGRDLSRPSYKMRYRCRITRFRNAKKLLCGYCVVLFTHTENAKSQCLKIQRQMPLISPQWKEWHLNLVRGREGLENRASPSQ